jgi:UDP-3-O-[3-hydroxymyristoyl] glucosamine N-acyltransferase
VRAIIHSGVVIGADGFGFAPDAGQWVKIPQIGRVIIGDDVEIGASTTVDRGALDDTLIGDGCKLDNQIQIGHNCVIGKHCVIAACAAVAGSVTLEDNVIVGGAAMIAGHVRIASGVVISGGSLVMKNITRPGQYTSVFPLEEHSHWLHNAAQIRHLAKLAERVSDLEKILKNTNTKD